MATITTIKEKIISLDQASFQILCDAYLSKEGYPNIVALGTKAGAQKTTQGTPDTYFFTADKKYVFVEYTTQQSSLVAKIEDDLNKCFDKSITGISVEDISEIIYCHTSSNISPSDDKKFRDQCEASGIKLSIIGIDVLADQLLNKYPKLVKDHLGLTIDTEQIQKPEDFIGHYNSNGLAAPLDTPFLFREKELAEIESAFQANKVVVLTGSAGVGKTKMALEFAKKHSVQYDETLYCIHDRALPMNDDLCAYLEKNGAYFLVIDDANQISNLGVIIDYVNRQSDGYLVNVIITVRDYAIDKVKYSLEKLTPYEIINIEPFSDDQIKELVRTSLGILNENYLDRIARISEGNSRMAILAGKIARQTNRLDSINDVTQLYEEYYGHILHDSTLQSNQTLLVSAGIIAFLNSIHLDRLESLNNFFVSNGLSSELFIKSMHDLHELEIVDIYHGKAVKISEQCFSNFILKYVFYDKKLLSLSAIIDNCFNSYRSRVIYSVNTIIGIFRDQRIRTFVESEIKVLWKQRFEENPERFMEFLVAFHGVDPTETLILLNSIIDNTDAVDLPVQSIDTDSRKNYKSIDDNVLTILGDFANLEDLDCALDLFFKYYLKRPDLYIQFYHAINEYYNVKVNSWKYGYFTQQKLIEKFVQYSDNWKNEYILLLFFDIAPNLLSLHFSPTEMAPRGGSIVIYNIYLTMSEGVLEYRQLIWNQLLLICRDHSDTVKKILYGYGRNYNESCLDVIKADFNFVEKIVKSIFSVKSLTDAIIVHHMRSIFESASIDSDIFDTYDDSDKMKLYRLLSGPQRSLSFKRGEREREKEISITNYIDSVSDKLNCFKTLFDICQEAHSFKDANHYEICNGLDIAILHIANDMECLISIVSLAIENDYIEYLSPRMTIEKLLFFMSPDEILELIRRIKSKLQQNLWEYNLYSNLPDTLINQAIVCNWYLFLSNKDDSEIISLPYRDISFLKKYEAIDKKIIINSIKVIFAKKEYSNYMTRIYLGLLFNSCHTTPTELISLFNKDMELLEDIYLWLEKYDCGNDCEGEYLFAIYNHSPSFLSKYVRAVYLFTQKHQLDDRFRKCRVFFNSDNYVEIFNTIIHELLSISPFPVTEVSDVIKCFLMKIKGEEERTEKSIKWMLHYIESNALDFTKMHCAFEGFSNADVESRLSFISQFLKINDNIEVFKVLPLTDYPDGWSNSTVPIYSSWLEYYSKLLPLLTGLKFIHHKKVIKDRMDDIQKMIVHTEISEILENSQID